MPPCDASKALQGLPPHSQEGSRGDFSLLVLGPPWPKSWIRPWWDWLHRHTALSRLKSLVCIRTFHCPWKEFLALICDHLHLFRLSNRENRVTYITLQTWMTYGKLTSTGMPISILCRPKSPSEALTVHTKTHLFLLGLKTWKVPHDSLEMQNSQRMNKENRNVNF